jgi:GlpG protein
MRGRWGSGPGGVRRRCPVTIGLIILSSLISLAANTLLKPDELPAKPPNEVLNSVSFVRHTERFNNFADVQRGQIWRLVTPAFIHFGLFHLIFNMWLMFVLGGQIEDRHGAKWYATFVLLAAVLSNIAQASVLQWMHYAAIFGGMSGVGYAVFGYLWMKVKFDPAAGFQLDKFNVIILMAVLVLCILREVPLLEPMLSFLPNAANTAHVVGLLVGMAAGYAPLLLRRR